MYLMHIIYMRSNTLNAMQLIKAIRQCSGQKYLPYLPTIQYPGKCPGNELTQPEQYLAPIMTVSTQLALHIGDFNFENLIEIHKDFLLRLFYHRKPYWKPQVSSTAIAQKHTPSSRFPYENRVKTAVFSQGYDTA